MSAKIQLKLRVMVGEYSLNKLDVIINKHMLAMPLLYVLN